MNKPILTLTQTIVADLPTFFSFQLDPVALHLAAFTPKDPSDQAAYLEKYTKHLADPSIHMRTIKIDHVIVGSIAKFMMGSQAGLTYWIDKPYWGQGIGTTALRQFLILEPTRPIQAHVAFDNFGSQKVLTNCGFVKIGSDKGFANARQAEIEEFIYQLN